MILWLVISFCVGAVVSGGFGAWFKRNGWDVELWRRIVAPALIVPMFIAGFGFLLSLFASVGLPNHGEVSSPMAIYFLLLFVVQYGAAAFLGGVLAAWAVDRMKS